MPDDKRRRGRPSSDQHDHDVKEALLQAARDCLMQKSYHAISTRELAEQAGTTLAMIRYYFGGKEGLLSALIERAADPVARQLSAIENLRELPPADRLRPLMSSLHQLARHSPWLLRLVVDDMTNQDDSLRQIFAERIVCHSRALLARFIEMQQDDGYYRPELDPTLAVVSLISLQIMPFLAAPMMKAGYGLDIHHIPEQQWLDHTCALLESGFRPHLEYPR